MGLVDKYIKTIIEKTTSIPSNDIFNIFQLKGGLPEKKCKDDNGKEFLKSYTQEDMFVLFGVEQGDTGKESVIITPQSGAPEGKIIIVDNFKIIVLFSGVDSDFYALKFKARLWATGVQEYLENNNITILTQNPTISFETEEVAGEFWDKRSIQFNILIELHFDDDTSEKFENLGEIYVHNN